MSIIISKDWKNAKRLRQTTFENEEELQKYIFNNPESIPLEEINEDVQFLVVDREFPLKEGSIDVLEVDSEGDIYIIETKLYKNPDKRFVLAQVLDYGASLWNFYEDPEKFIQKLDQRLINKTNKGLNDIIGGNFGNTEEILDNIKQNVINGTFKFVILMDKVPQNLKNLILFINQNSQFNVYLVEMEYYKHEDYEILIPHVFGAESKKKVISVSRRKKWDENSFFEDAKRKPAFYDAVRKLYKFSQQKANEISWGTGSTTGSFNPKFHSISKRSIYTVWSDGRLTINYGWLDDNEHMIQFREKLLFELKKIKSIANYVRKSGNKYPIIPPIAWTPVVEKLMRIIKKLLEEDS